MLIRAFKENDRVPLRALFLKTRRSAWPWLDGSAWRLDDFDTVTEGEQIWVAEDNHQLSGFASVWVADNFLHSLYVAPEYQGKRIGQALLGRVQAEFTGDGTLKCLVKNHSAFAFYLHQGWSIESRGESDDGEYYLMRFAKK